MLIYEEKHEPPEYFRLAGGLGAAAMARASAKADQTQAPRAVYHLVDAGKAAFVLGNMRNHLKGTAPDPAKLAVVVHGPALKAFKTDAQGPRRGHETKPWPPALRHLN